MKNVRYVALLCGINVGGNRKVPMAQLKKVMEKAGYENVKTLLASGNLMFDANKQSLATLTKKLAAALEKEFGFSIGVVLRTMEHVHGVVASKPFKKFTVKPETRLCVVFLTGDTPKGALHIPYTSPEGDLEIFKATETEAFCVLTLSEDRRSIDVMALLGKEYGKNVTTRNWNTVMKIAAS